MSGGEGEVSDIYSINRENFFPGSTISRIKAQIYYKFDKLTKAVSLT